MQTDYSDIPLNTPVETRNRNALADAASNTTRHFGNISCIHGHFLPAKYRPLKKHGALFVTWLRDPLERMVSHYNFWRRTYVPALSPALHRRVVEEQWSLERFAFAEEMRNVYAQFLWSFPLTLFNFVGVVEHFTDDLFYFAEHFLGRTLNTAPRVNTASNPYANAAIVEKLRDRFTEFHALDYDIYHSAVALRAARTSADKIDCPSG